MSDSPLHSSWNSTDSSEDRVPVQAAQEESVQHAVPEPVHRVSGRAASVRIDAPTQSNMHLAALTGIGLVMLLGSIFYLGTDSLRGSLIGGSRLVEITITEENVFSPASVTVKPGDELVFINAFADPHILQATGEHELFLSGVHVLPGEQYSHIVGESAVGKTYLYGSALLDEDQFVEIRVTDGSEQNAESSSSSEEDIFIPLPPETINDPPVDDIPPPEDIPESSSSSVANIPLIQAVSSSAGGQPLVVALLSSSFSNTASTGTPSTFSLRGSAGESSSSSLPSLTGNQGNLPNNPYTIGSRTEAERLGLLPVRSSTSSSLKSGADLRRIETPVTTTRVSTPKPRTNVETGPGPTMLIVTLLTMGLMGLYYRRITRTA